MKQTQSLKGESVRSDKGHPQLTPRDDTILRLIGEQTGYRFDQLQALLARHPDTTSKDSSFLSESRTFALLQRWKTLGLAAYDKIYYHDPGWIWLTRKGLAHVDLTVRFLDLYHADLNHLFWINETRALIEETYGARPGFRFESERVFRATRERLKAQQKREPDLWIPFEYRGNHRPDALLRYRLNIEPDAREVVSALEIELSPKDAETWKKTFLELTQFYDAAHYFVAPTVKSSLVKVLAQFHEEEQRQRQSIHIHDLDQRLS